MFQRNISPLSSESKNKQSRWQAVIVHMTVGDNYTDTEMADMHFTYGLADGSMREA
jgi:hypothetical protein